MHLQPEDSGRCAARPRLAPPSTTFFCCSAPIPQKPLDVGQHVRGPETPRELGLCLTFLAVLGTPSVASPRLPTLPVDIQDSAPSHPWVKVLFRKIRLALRIRANGGESTSRASSKASNAGRPGFDSDRIRDQVLQPARLVRPSKATSSIARLRRHPRFLGAPLAGPANVAHAKPLKSLCSRLR